VCLLPLALPCGSVPPWSGEVAPGVGWKDFFKRDDLSSGLVP